MSCYVSIDLTSAKSEEQCDSSQLQFIPAKTCYNGEAKVQTYFTDFVQKDSDDKTLLHTSIRGRPLDGRIVETPKGYSAFVVEGGGPGASLGGDDTSGSGAQEVKMRAVSQPLTKMTVWNWDKAGAPAHDNPVSKAFQWLDIANAVADGGLSEDEDEKENEDSDATRKRKRED